MKPLYIVAVSGGVDSIVLLDMLVRTGQARLIIAHVDHGIRPESADDAAFVARLAHAHGLEFESTTLQLGQDASEERARDERWRFLRAISEKHHADRIITAHHADDVVETMIINLMRGTGWRGIATLRETDEILRPLLVLRKKDIIRYAEEHGLEWREDATNHDQTYMRNRVRHNVMPQLNDDQFTTFMQLHASQCGLRSEIEQLAHEASPVLARYPYIMEPDGVARELLRRVVGSLTQRESDRALLFVRTARPRKQLRLSNGIIMRVNVRQFIVSRG